MKTNHAIMNGHWIGSCIEGYYEIQITENGKKRREMK